MAEKLPASGLPGRQLAGCFVCELRSAVCGATSFAFGRQLSASEVRVGSWRAHSMRGGLRERSPVDSIPSSKHEAVQSAVGDRSPVDSSLG